MMPEWHRAECTVTTDPARIDVTAVLELLHGTHWGGRLTRPTLDAAIRHSIPFGLLAGPDTVGFARVVSDRATFAYLCDVVVAPAWRGRGLGQWMVECALAHPELQGLRRFSLMTRDAQGLYERLGFTTDTAGSVYMERRGRSTASPA